MSTESRTDRRGSIDWVAIRSEHDLGQLSIKEIGRQYGCSDTAIIKRRKAEGWPPRMTGADREQLARPLLSGEILGPSTPQERGALVAFERFVGVLLAHRRGLARIRAEVDQCMEDVAEYRRRVIAQGRALRLDEIQMLADVALKASKGMSQVVPLELRSVGISAKDDPSEFESLQTSQLEQLETVVRQAGVF